MLNNSPKLCPLAQILVDECVVWSDLVEKLVVVTATGRWKDSRKVKPSVTFEFPERLIQQCAMLGTNLRNFLENLNFDAVVKLHRWHLTSAYLELARIANVHAVIDI